MAHIGLMPQQTNAMGGYKVVRDTADFAQVIADAKALEEAGAFAVLIEGVVPDLARQVTAAVRHSHDRYRGKCRLRRADIGV